jgi:hypothetical protein
LVIDESRIETGCPEGCSQLKGPPDAAKTLRRGFSDHICGSQVDEQSAGLSQDPGDLIFHNLLGCADAFRNLLIG